MSTNYINKIKDENSTAYDINDTRLKIGYDDNSINAGTNYTDNNNNTYVSTAGMKAFCWNEVTVSPEDNLVYTFSLVDESGVPSTLSEYIPLGSDVSIKAYYSWSFAGVTEAQYDIGSDQIIVTLSKTPPSNWNPFDHTVNDEEPGYLWFPAYPNAGIIPKGIRAVNIGRGNIANEEGSLSIGRQNIADGRYSFAGGRENEVAYASVVSGFRNKAYGIQGAVFGKDNVLYGNNAFVSGDTNKVDAGAGCTVGYKNTVDSSSTNSLVAGENNTLTNSKDSIIIGNNNKATNNYHIVGGNGNTVSGYYNAVNGQSNTVSGERNIVSGNYGTVTSTYSLLLSRLTSNPIDWSASTTYSQGVACRYDGVIYSSTHTNNLGNTPPDVSSTTVSDYAHWLPVARVEGTGSVSFGLSGVTGKYSLATGNTNLIKGDYGFASGIGNLVLSASSSAVGVGLIANGTTQNVRGRYNVALGDSYAEVVGRGTTYSNRKNISALTTDGDLRLKRNIYVNCNDDSSGGT